MSHFWVRGFNENAALSGPSTFVPVLLHTDTGTGFTNRRLIVDWDINLLNTSTDFGLPSQAPSAVGIATTTAPLGTAPAAPVDGPLTAPSIYNWWWLGAPWRPIYVPAAGNSFWGVEGRIDDDINHSYSLTQETSVWAVAEVDDSTPIFAEWSFTCYYQFLEYSPG